MEGLYGFLHGKMRPDDTFKEMASHVRVCVCVCVGGDAESVLKPVIRHNESGIRTLTQQQKMDIWTMN